MQRRDINAADAPAPAGQYTQAVEVTGASRTLYLSGQVGIASYRRRSQQFSLEGRGGGHRCCLIPCAS